MQRAFLEGDKLAPKNPTVCFYKDVSYKPTDSEFEAKMAEWKGYWAAWEKVSGVRFQYTGICEPQGDDGFPEDIRVGIVTSAQDASDLIPGKGCTREYEGGNRGAYPSLWSAYKNCAFNVKIYYSEGINKVPHEMGHALGLGDENHRLGAPSNGCAYAQGNDFDSAAGRTHSVLTRPDPDSLMAYGDCDNSDARGLSDWDELAVEIMYPKSSGIPLSFVAGIAFAGNWVIRDNGRIESGWYARGALASVFDTPTWKITPLYSDVSSSLPGPGSIAASNLQDGLWSAVSFSFTDPWNRHREAQQFVQPSNAKHAAVLMAAL